MSPTVSVIIPTYNRAHKIRNAIDSVLGQTLSDLELIVVDDGSSDNTGELVQDTYGDRIRYFGRPNQGVSAARNNGLAEARGEWIAFLDSDDFWEKDKLEWQFKALQRFGSNCGACYTDVRFLSHPERRTMFQLADDTDRHHGTMGIGANILKLLVRPGGAGMVVCICSVLTRTDLARRAGGFDRNLQFGEDSEFLFRLAMLTNFCYVNRPLVCVDRSPADIRHTGVSSEWNKQEVLLRDFQLKFEALERMAGTVPWTVRKLIRQQLGTVQSGWANWYLETGQWANAREAASKAVRLDLRFTFVAKWLLTWMAPHLALRAVQQYQQRRRGFVPFV